MKILDDTKTLTELVNDKTNGIGRIFPISAYVDEELNGIYELNFDISIEDKHFKDIKQGSLIQCNAGEIEGEQIFRVVKISKPLNQICSIYCQHISYDLNKTVVLPFTATGAVQTKDRLLSNLQGTYPFTMTTNITNVTSKFILDIPMSFRGALGGWQGSILDTFKCEYEFDNLNVKMLNRRGSDTDVRIAYGKNLTDIKQEENIENTYNAILGYATVDEVTTTSDVIKLVNTNTPKVMIVDFSNEYDADNKPTKAKLNTLARAYATNNKINTPKVNIEFSFIPLWNTEEYKNIAPLERLTLGDTITVQFDKLGVDASAKVISRTWNVLLEKYESMQVGDANANLSTAISESLIDSSIAKERRRNNFMQNALNQVATLVTNGLGLFTTNIESDDGTSKIYLHNKPELSESQYQWTINSGVFAVSDDYGKTWNAGITSSGDAVFNILSANTIKAIDIYGSYMEGSEIVFKANNKSVTASPFSGKVYDNTISGVLFEGDGDLGIKVTDYLSLYGNQVSVHSNESSSSNKYAHNGLFVNKSSTLLTAGDNSISMSPIGNQTFLSSTGEIWIQSYGGNSGGAIRLTAPGGVYVNGTKIG